ILKAANVFAANNCANATTSSQNAIGCLSAQLLGAELNVSKGGNTCINATITQANSFLKAMPKSPSGTMSSTGPTGNYSALTTAGRTTALSLQAALVKYNQGGGC